jgi:hypothetical protein
VWDSQIGMAGRPERLAPLDPTPEEDDFAEPEIPEYLLAERRRSNSRPQGGRGGARGGNRSAYASAVDRERFGGSRTSSSRYPEPARQPQSQPQTQRRRDERPLRPQGAVVRRGELRPIVRDSAEPWSEVPPELEELLRAQLSTKIARSGEAAETAKAAPAEAAAKPATRRGGRRKPEAETAVAEAAPAVEAPAEAKPKAARTRRKPAADVEAAPAAAVAPAADTATAEKPKRRAPARRKPAAEDASGETTAE